MKIPLAIKIGSVLLIILVNIMVIEAALRFYLWVVPPRDYRYAARVIGLSNSSFWRIRWILEHEDKEITYNLFSIFDPNRGWAVKPNLHNVPVFKDQLLNTNSKGLRGKSEYAYVKTPGKIRILVLGDSFTFGDEVSDDETYPHYLQALLPQSEVLNFGVYGYGHDQMLLYFKREGIKYSPDIVILGFVHDDMIRNMLEFRDYAKPQFELTNDELKLTNVPVTPPEVILEREFYRLKIVDFLSILYQNLMWKWGQNESKMTALTTALLDELVTTIETSGATPVFVYLPFGKEMKSKEKTAGEEFFFNYCESRDIYGFSLRPYFVGNRKRPLKKFLHYTPHGNLLVAKTIKDFLYEKKLIKIPESINFEDVIQ